MKELTNNEMMTSYYNTVNPKIFKERIKQFKKK